MSWLATETLTAQLPDPGGLRAAAYDLRHAGDSLGAQASATRGVANAIVPSVWQDEASDRVRAILGQIDTELSTGSSALHQAADVLDSLAGYVSGQQWQYEETGRVLEGLARDPIGTVAHHELAEAAQLIEERRSIERGVSAAMGHASDVINTAASRAARYHGGQSFWSSLEQDAVKSAESVWHTDSQFARGVWDGTYGLVEGTAETVWSLTVLGAKLSPARMLIDPAGWNHDYEQALNTGWTTADYITHHKKQFIETLLNLKDLRSDPAHWFGELVPLIASIVITKGAASFAAEGAESTNASDAAVRAASEAADLSKMTKEERVSYAGNIAAGHTPDVPHLSQVTLRDGTQVRFPANANFSFGAKSLEHVLYGAPNDRDEGYGGGHLFPGQGGKYAFPNTWDSSKIVKETYSLLEDPDTVWTAQRGNPPSYNVTGFRDGLLIRVAVSPYGKGIITSFPDYEIPSLVYRGVLRNL